ncbi:DUF4198 domain-containing protein [Octadecabacter sp. 1_MG-2023]|uniref:DUF4198 domain-containing protein n=1 Tax=unclassified Octadecabacter TaxID=196158 RepID=UPI001C0866AF|nr:MULTISPECIES: DUF4198 domain-containing protein [unclassified Octadecabacter]MBU2993269.1 DUF4198 domain-containing protein [Octadecabacter sp. B2R22]MDO6733276.1 DUF4198 domain-containing protein [Octadecabacter sp. 1_MG-2023]
MRILAALSALTLALPVPSALVAHEFWIEPLAFQIEPDARMQGKLLNGEDFGGVEQAYLPQRIDRFNVSAGMQRANVENRLGARPALDVAPLSEGLNIVTYGAQLSTITYTDWEKFLGFAEHKGFEDIEARHDARGLPREDFTEGYWRFAKSLIGVGHSVGRDYRVGLGVEFVALDNPYTDDLSDGLRVQLYFLADTVADGQVELFEKAPDGTVDITYHRTDADGIATLPVQAGHSYLVDHVVLQEPSEALAAQADIEWETLWAALTFGVPE